MMGGPEKSHEREHLLRRAPEEAIRLNAHLLLHDLRDGEVTRFLFAEAWSVYLTVQFAMLLMRRNHELAPMHTDLFDRVRENIGALIPGGDYSIDAFANDMNQLASWGCVTKEIEVSRIRGYRDRSRENYRYTLTGDAVSFLEWLEGRLDDRVRGTSLDGRDLMIDLVGRLQDAMKLVRKAKVQGFDDESARRLIHLLDSVDQGMDQITSELTVLRAEMQAFVRGAADERDLKRVVAGLERYVTQYVRRMRELGARAYLTARRLSQHRTRDLLASAREKLLAERVLGRHSMIEPAEVLDRALPFLKRDGRLVQVCSEVETMASEVVRRVDRRLRDLELRNFRLEELRARLEQMAWLPESESRLGGYLARLVAFAHMRYDPHPESDGSLARPPAPRRTADWSGSREPAPIRTKRLKIETVYQATESRRRRLRDFVRMTLLAGRSSGRLDEVSLKPDEDPLEWLSVAKARYLAGGRELRRAGIAASKIEGAVRLNAGRRHLATPNHALQITSESDG